MIGFDYSRLGAHCPVCMCSQSCGWVLNVPNGK